MDEIMSIEDIHQLVVQGYKEWKRYGDVTVRVMDDLLIFNYNNNAVFTGRWNYFERVSRGLIINHKTGEIVARPFDKFYNWGQSGQVAKHSAHIVAVTDKLDGCFRFDTPLQCWDGSTILIGDVVNQKLTPVLMGMDESGQIVPCEIVRHFDNGTKDNWLAITVSCPVSKKSGAANKPNIIRVTDNHCIYLNNAFQPAINASVGDTVTTFDFQPDESVLHMIEASLPGDGSLTPTHNGWRFQEPHTERHYEYTNTIRGWLGECAQIERTTQSGYGSKLWWASSKQYTILRQLRDKWYPDGKKVIPCDLSWMDDFAVAKWYMDDGSLAHSTVQEDRANFATNAFEKADVERLANRLMEMYSVKCIVFNSKGWNIRINAGRDRAINRFWSAIAPHIVPCMRYKLPVRYREIEYIPYPSGTQKVIPLEAKILHIEPIPVSKKNFPTGRKGFDIQTTTGNYFAKGILVHNSLGVLFRHKGQFRIATRGAFESEQAQWATKFLNDYFDLTGLPNELTLLFEIIYPANRIVVDYADREDLVLLAARNRYTGDYLSFFPDVYTMGQQYGFTLPQTYSFNDITQILEDTGVLDVSREGYVVEFSDGSRFKFKGDRYIELQRLIMGLTFKNTLKALEHGTINDILNSVPDEFLDEVRGWIGEIQARIASVTQQVQAAFEAAPKDSRKEFALWVNQHHPAISHYLFFMIEGRDILPLIYQREEWGNRDETPRGLEE